MRSTGAQHLVSLVVLRIGFRRFITAFQEMGRLLQRVFEDIEHVVMDLHETTVCLGALVVGKQPVMVADIRKEEGGQEGAIGDVATGG